MLDVIQASSFKLLEERQKVMLDAIQAIVFSTMWSSSKSNAECDPNEVLICLEQFKSNG